MCARHRSLRSEGKLRRQSSLTAVCCTLAHSSLAGTCTLRGSPVSASRLPVEALRSPPLSYVSGLVGVLGIQIHTAVLFSTKPRPEL